MARLHVRDRAHLDAVAGELDIWEVHYDAGYALVALRPSQVAWLRGLGYRLEVEAERTTRLQAPAAPLDPRYYYFDDDYVNPNGLYVVDFLYAISDTYPNLVELTDVGDGWAASHGGHRRDIWLLRITNEDPAYGEVEEKPAFFLFATIHAREVAAAELAIRYVRYLTEGYDGQGGYGVDPDVTWLVDHHVAYVLVMQNPDGHRVDEEDTGAYRRKNVDNDDGCDDPRYWGVDLNRNHSFMWGCCGGSSPNPCSSAYRGPARASEPETQAFESAFAAVMRDQNGPNGDDELPPAAPITTTGIFISLHSYGDLVLWPWYFTGDPAPNSDGLETIGRKLASYNGFDPAGDLYLADGTTDEWTYGRFGIPSFSFEVGPNGGDCRGFFPPYGCIDGVDGVPRSFWDENRPAFLYAHRIARAPYRTAYGPDALEPDVVPDAVFPGATVRLSATIADRRYGDDALRPVAAAEFFVDAPGDDGAGTPMSPADGAWGEVGEAVTATIDTSGLAPGRHYLLIHGQNDEGDWGPFTAVFLDVADPAVSPILEGYVRDAESSVPISATVTAGSFYTQTNPVSGYYSMTVISGTYAVSAAAPDYATATVTGVTAYDHQTVQRDFYLLAWRAVHLPLVLKNP